MKQDGFAYEELLMGMFAIDDSKYEDTDFNDLTLTHFSVDFEQFAGVVDALLPLSPVVSSPMSGKKYHAFMSKDGQAFIKTEADV
ncbi:hypothetical protein FZ143_22175 [Salmonella enterica]|nr:hypothetical protein [Salmonella enterica]